jgi:predicted PolB exonuclease-like 3'-5' exonuclease
MTLPPVLVFDLETIPDLATARRWHDFAGLEEDAILAALQTLRRVRTGNDFLALPLHRVVSIGMLYVTPTGKLGLSALGRETSSEAELLQRFFHIIEQKTPTLVSWNGTGFDCPVLHYRALRHGVEAARYWEQGDDDRSFRFDNYLNRFHWRHIDLMDVLAGFQPRASASLDQVATMLGFPGKLGMDGSAVWSAWRSGERARIHDYVEHDVLNTYLVYLRFERMRGRLTAAGLAEREDQLQMYLQDTARPSHLEFLHAWQQAREALAQDAQEPSGSTETATGSAGEIPGTRRT